MNKDDEDRFRQRLEDSIRKGEKAYAEGRTVPLEDLIDDDDDDL